MYRHTGQRAKSTLNMHCRRELMHTVWRLLLDDELKDAYARGIVVLCIDEIVHCIMLRIFTYAADYPEKCVTVQHHS
jgi:hypothetical protein